ncbi:ribonuclease Z [Singulisphaera sp. GP187]|uniref:MBL fold metallo-hydrolase n=1 Tax=Singulisphaera sp. GP187 TaxID=1882752 RepID=UPI000925DFD7|nr:MBL fold metallo-hydrolase [Singulisphaera sp. GP187]SIO61786.1 ribonuclease Z [Singulisphaera sp. GP187]
MRTSRKISEIRLLNGSTGDPGLYIDHPGRDDAILFDAGENATLGMERLADLEAVFITHHHVDHFIGFDRIVRANLDRDKTLQVYGPEGTIAKVYGKIKSYEYPFFPFQKIVIDVHEVHATQLRTARLECTRRFPRPKVQEVDWNPPVIYETDDLKVEAAHVDHTVPCLAFAWVEKPGIAPDPSRLKGRSPSRSPWINEALGRLRAGAPLETPVVVDGQARLLGELRDQYFMETEGSRIAYVTDTAWSESVRPALLRLAGGANRLYCDSFYAQEQIQQADKHHHMTATQAAEFALAANVEELILIHFSTRYAGRFDALVDEARARFPRVSAEIPPAPQKKSTRTANPS